MNALLISIAVATLGIDVGWQRLPEGGMQKNIIQLDPQAPVPSRRGPADRKRHSGQRAGDVQSYRIIVGKGPLRRNLPPQSTLANSPGAESTAARGPALLVPPTLEPPRGVKPCLPGSRRFSRSRRASGRPANRNLSLQRNPSTQEPRNRGCR